MHYTFFGFAVNVFIFFVGWEDNSYALCKLCNFQCGFWWWWNQPSRPSRSFGKVRRLQHSSCRSSIYCPHRWETNQRTHPGTSRPYILVLFYTSKDSSFEIMFVSRQFFGDEISFLPGTNQICIIALLQGQRDLYMEDSLERDSKAWRV